MSLYDTKGKKIQLEEKLAELADDETLELNVIVNCATPDSKVIKRQVRICAVKKSKEAIQKEAKRIHRHKSKQQLTLSKKAEQESRSLWREMKFMLRQFRLLLSQAFAGAFSTKPFLEIARLLTVERPIRGTRLQLVNFTLS